MHSLVAVITWAVINSVPSPQKCDKYQLSFACVATELLISPYRRAKKDRQQQADVIFICQKTAEEHVVVNDVLRINYRKTSLVMHSCV